MNVKKIVFLFCVTVFFIGGTASSFCSASSFEENDEKCKILGNLARRLYDDMEGLRKEQEEFKKRERENRNTFDDLLLKLPLKFVRTVRNVFESCKKSGVQEEE